MFEHLLNTVDGEVIEGYHVAYEVKDVKVADLLKWAEADCSSC